MIALMIFNDLTGNVKRIKIKFLKPKYSIITIKKLKKQ